MMLGDMWNLEPKYGGWLDPRTRLPRPEVNHLSVEDGGSTTSLGYDAGGFANARGCGPHRVRGVVADFHLRGFRKSVRMSVAQEKRAWL